MAKTRVFEFADFRLDETERVLYQRGQPVALAPKVFDTLYVLVKNHGRVVSKSDLMKEVWQEAFVEENNLTQHIFILRKVLRQHGGEQQFIETVPRRGYRFLGSVIQREIVIGDEFANDGFVSQIQEPVFAENRAVLQLTDKLAVKPADESNERTFVPPTEIAPPLASEKFGLRRRFFLIFASVIFLTVVSLGFALRSGWRQNSLASTFSPQDLTFKRLTESGDLFGAAISPDGNSLAYTARGKRIEVRLKNISTDSEIVLAKAENGAFNSPRFSPDGDFVYYAYGESNQNASAFRVPVLGGEPVRVADNLYSEFAVSPDGRQIAFPRKIESEKKHVVIVAATDGSRSERTVAECSDPDFFALWGPAPAWSPDGERLTVVIGNFGAKQEKLLEINLRNGERRELKLQDSWRLIESLKWARENELIVVGQKEAEEKLQLWQINFPAGVANRITNDANEYTTVDLNRDGNQIVTTQRTESFHLWLFDRETNQIRQLTSGESHREGLEGLVFAPDNRIVYTEREKNKYDIFSMNADGSDVRRLTRSEGRFNLMPAVSPDNRVIAFASNRGDGATMRIWLMNADGSSPRQLTPAPDDAQTNEGDPYFSPDGRWIYYTSYRSGHSSIYKISVEGGEPVEVKRDVSIPVVSPDEREIAVNVYDENAPQQWQLRVLSLDGTNDKAFDFPAFFLRARWLPVASHTLVAADAEQDGNNLWQTNFETGERRQITDLKAERIDRFDVSKNGRFFVLARGSELYDAVLIER